MKKDFRVGQSNEVIKDGLVHDLHNCFDPIELAIQFDRTVTLKFRASPEHPGGHTGLELSFIGFDYLEVSSNLGAAMIRDLDEIGYKAIHDHDDTWLLTEEQSSSNDHMFFRFINGGFVRIHSATAHLHAY